jgi:hypothetical protein
MTQEPKTSTGLNPFNVSDMQLAEELQKEAHRYASAVVSEKVAYQDAINVWIYLRLAQIINTQTQQP